MTINNYYQLFLIPAALKTFDELPALPQRAGKSYTTCIK